MFIHSNSGGAVKEKNDLKHFLFLFLLVSDNWKERENFFSPCPWLYKDLCLYDNRKVDLLDMETASEKSVG